MGTRLIGWKQNRNNQIENRLLTVAGKNLYKAFAQKICSAIFFTATIVTTFATAFAKPVFAANPTILYDGKKQEVAFENISGTDLFNSFKGLMPGDVREQTIDLTAKRISRETSFYLQTDCDERTRALLQDVTLSLYDGETLLLDNAKLSESVKLGTVGESKSLHLKAVIHVPLTKGNEIAGETLQIKWRFIVQEDGKELVNESLPDSPSNGPSNTVTTGDSVPFIPVLGIAVVSLALIVWVFMRTFKRNKRNL